MQFIRVTYKDGRSALININFITHIIPMLDGRLRIFLSQGNGCIEVLDTIEDIDRQLNTTVYKDMYGDTHTI